jgi:hypothetical protein
VFRVALGQGSPLMRCALARAIGVTPTNESELRAMRAAAWHRQGVAVLRIEDIDDDWLRQAVTNLSNRLYGVRDGKTERR